MVFKNSLLSRALQRYLPYKISGKSRSLPWTTPKLQNRNPVQSAGRSSSFLNPHSWWATDETSPHLGPKARIPDLFQRNDELRLTLASQQLEWYGSPPLLHHDLLAAAARVGRIEERIQYTFENKMTCVEALKVTSSVTPLYFKGMIHKVDRNNRLALLGDRALRLALCEMWFHTGNSPGDYSDMQKDVESRFSLSAKGIELGFDKELLIPEGLAYPRYFQIAEAFEAIFGAVYLDSGHNLDVIKKIIKDIKLDGHQALTPRPESHKVQSKREFGFHQVEKKLLGNKTRLLKRAAFALQKGGETDTFVAKQQREDLTADPEINATVKTKAEAPERKAAAPKLVTEDAETVVEEQPKDKLVTDPQPQTDSKKDVDDLQATTENLPSENSADNDIPTTPTNQQDPPAPLIQEQTSAEATPDAATQPPPPSPAIQVYLETGRPPQCKSRAITSVVSKIEALNKRRSSISAKRAKQRWALMRKVVWQEAWDAAIEKANRLRDQTPPVDPRDLYEQILRQRLEAILEREKKHLNERDAQREKERSKQLQEQGKDGALGEEAHASLEDSEREAFDGVEEREGRGKKDAPAQG